MPPDVRRWIGRQDEAERDALARTWALAGLAGSVPAPPDTDAAWTRLEALLDAPGPGLEAPGPARASRRRDRPAAARGPVRLRRAVPVAALAAAVAAVVAVGLWLRPVTVAAGPEVAAVTLPDGSEVTLAPGARLRYRRGLRGDARRVGLDGQGYFAVDSGSRPFVVETFNAEVEVLGTAFDVLAWPGAGETAVALAEGRVRLRGGGAEVALEPGEVSRVAGGGAPTPPVRADVEAVAAWRAGAFSVVDAPLAVVAEALEARFGRPVRLGAGVEAGRRLTLFLPSADSADAVLRDVAAYLDLRLQSGPDGYTVLPR